MGRIASPSVALRRDTTPAPLPFVDRQEGNLPPLNTFAVHLPSLSQGRILAVIPVGL